MTATLNAVELALQWMFCFMVGMSCILGLYLVGWAIQEYCERKEEEATTNERRTR